MKIHAIQTGTVAIRPNQRQGKGNGYDRLLNTLTDRRWTEPLAVCITFPKRKFWLTVGLTNSRSDGRDRRAAFYHSIGRRGSIPP